jgi:hypothetical protein
MNTEQIAQATLANDPIEIRRMYEEQIRRQQQQHQQDVEHLEELCLVRLRDQQRENEERLGYVEQGCLARIRAERRRVEQECEQRIQEERRRAEPKIGPGPRRQSMVDFKRQEEEQLLRQGAKAEDQRREEKNVIAEPKIGPGPREQMMLDHKRAIESEPVFKVRCTTKIQDASGRSSKMLMLITKRHIEQEIKKILYYNGIVWLILKNLL